MYYTYSWFGLGFVISFLFLINTVVAKFICMSSGYLQFHLTFIIKIYLLLFESICNKLAKMYHGQWCS